ncbi:MAG: hypothetical protein IPK16_15655 [Anaerolineales bacterium]|nr:hypothetical protein [Anaerolineales bacterium]
MNSNKMLNKSLAALLVTSILLGSMSSLAFAQSIEPKPPIGTPKLSGKSNPPASPGAGATTAAKTTTPATTGRLSGLAELMQCVDDGKTMYGVTIQTTNVRSAPSTEACRFGKLPKATVVAVTAYTESKPPAVAAPAAPTGPTLGYVEDIQPLFERACAACHSAAARTMGLVATTYPTLMAGGQNGPVIVPGDPDASKLWQYLGIGKMPATRPLPLADQQLVRDWIAQGAAERRAATPKAATAETWLTIANPTLTAVSDACANAPTEDNNLVSADLIIPVRCGAEPAAAEVKTALAGGRTATTGTATSTAAAAPVAAATTNVARGANASKAGIQAAALGLPAPAETDPYMAPAGFCMERRLADNHRGITAMAFGPDGKLFLALDSDLAHDIDPLILYDAFHPSRSVAVYDYINDMTPVEIMTESSRITGLDWQDGTLYLSRAGEVGRIPDGSSYEPLAGGFAVSGQLFHANNGIVLNDGWVYVSAGGIVDGYVEGPITGIDESGAQNIVSGGNPYAARIVRAPLDTLLSQRSINAFSTAGRGVRNPYGITADPSGRIWFTDNGATNVPDEIPAGDEIDVLDPAVIGGDESSTPTMAFRWRSRRPPRLVCTAPGQYGQLLAAPTGITWAYDTIFYGAYGRNPGLYRLGRASDGALIGERIMMAWPVLSLATAPDGALWVGMGDGGLYRMTPGCN